MLLIKKWLPKIIIVIAIIAICSILFEKCSSNVEHKAFLAQVDSLHKVNDSLSVEIMNDNAIIDSLNYVDAVLTVKSNILKDNIKALKEDKSKLEAAAKMKPYEIDSFFVVRYAEQYKVETKDTTILPVPVSKAVVVDLIDFDRTKNIVLNQDSLITNLESTVNGKDKVIVTLRTKEGNYESIIQKQVQQQDNYKIIVEGLKGDIKKLDRKNKINKLAKFGMGFLILGLAVTHK